MSFKNVTGCHVCCVRSTHFSNLYRKRFLLVLSLLLPQVNSHLWFLRPFCATKTMLTLLDKTLPVDLALLPFGDGQERGPQSHEEKWQSLFRLQLPSAARGRVLRWHLPPSPSNRDHPLGLIPNSRDCSCPRPLEITIPLQASGEILLFCFI